MNRILFHTTVMDYLDDGNYISKDGWNEIKYLAIKGNIRNKKYACLPKFANLLKHKSSLKKI